MSRNPAEIPVLMYHKVGCSIETRADTFLNVSTEDFRRQVRFLATRGFKARPFTEVVESLVCGRSLPRRVFAVTFDDGYQCIAESAAPVLAEFGFPATVFIVPDHLGRSNEWDRATGRPQLPIMELATLRQLLEAGWEAGGHTMTHPHLNGLSDDDALADIAAGKTVTEALIGQSLTTFCYPFGHYNTRTPQIVRAAGFIGACTTRSGLVTSARDPYLLPRIKVAYRDGLFGMVYRLLVRPHLPTLRRRHYS